MSTLPLNRKHYYMLEQRDTKIKCAVYQNISSLRERLSLIAC